MTAPPNDSMLLRCGWATTDPEFKLRVQAAIFKLAQDVMNEDPNGDNHVLREQLAQSIISDPTGVSGRFVWLCASNPTIASTVNVEAGANGPDVQVGCPDDDILYVCASNWNRVAQWQQGPAALFGVG